MRDCSERKNTSNLTVHGHVKLAVTSVRLTIAKGPIFVAQAYVNICNGTCTFYVARTNRHNIPQAVVGVVSVYCELCGKATVGVVVRQRGQLE